MLNFRKIPFTSLGLYQVYDPMKLVCMLYTSQIQLETTTTVYLANAAQRMNTVTLLNATLNHTCKHTKPARTYRDTEIRNQKTENRKLKTENRKPEQG